ncbi:MAG: hypothetical protein CMC76_12475 [Flavobacteriaceae bacterium]|nr:hypothetical protein [Flavobacteriaceae bacterium]|tara:strand:+ start:4729 stop:6543 length:1815 start_codon:yes stop_codon:yes gene_type:complete
MIDKKDVLDFLLKYPKPILEKINCDEIIKAKKLDKVKVLYHYYQIQAPYVSPVYDSDSLTDKEFFKVFISSDNLEQTLSQIRARHTTLSEPSEKRFIYIKNNEIDTFFNRFGENKEVIFSDYSNTHIKWTNELITNHKDIWDWDSLHRNPVIKWNFDLIENNKEFLNWSFISSYPNLIWTEKELKKYEDYLIFSRHKWYAWEKSGTNKKGKKSCLVKTFDNEYAHQKNPFSYLDGSISLSKTLNWSKNIINSVKHSWDWTDLSSNNSIRWDSDLIDFFINHIDFKSLSSNTNVDWSDTLIKKYFDKWCWNSLSGNPSLPWSFQFISKFENKWIWKDYTALEYFNFDKEILPSISSNKGILWDKELLSKYIDKIDLWIISRIGKLTNESIRLFKNHLNRSEKIGVKTHDWSDWREHENIYVNGWENLAQNKLFKVYKENLNFYLNQKIDFSYLVGNLAHNGYYEVKYKNVLELFENCELADFNFKDFINLDKEWNYCFYNDKFINEHLWTNFVKNHLNINLIEKFIKKLLLKIFYETSLFLEKYKPITELLKENYSAYDIRDKQKEYKLPELNKISFQYRVNQKIHEFIKTYNLENDLKCSSILR